MLKTTYAPDIDSGKEEEPDNINEVPIPSSRFKADMFLRGEMPLLHAQIANEEEDRSDHNVETMETRGKEEGREEAVATEGPVVMGEQFVIFEGLKTGEDQAKNGTNQKAVFNILAAFIMNKRVVRPSHGTARQKQDQGVDQRQMPYVKDIDFSRHIE